MVHRDIKPSNIVVDSAGAPKLLDFGIAKLLDPTVGMLREARTGTGVALFTPEYASPEQARGQLVSVATDVYSLGAVLFELIAGQPPQRAVEDALATMRTICEVEPPRPSTVAPIAVRRQLAGDLDSIALKALQKQPAHRYISVADLARDLERFLGGHAVAAREATLRYRASKLLARNLGKIILSALAIAMLLAAVIVSLIEARRAGEHARRAQRQTNILLGEQAREELAHAHFGRALPYLAEALQQGEDTPAIRFLLAEAMRPFDNELVRLGDFADGVLGVAWSPDGRYIAASIYDGTVRFYDGDGKLRALRRVTSEPWPVEQTASAAAPAFSADSMRLATAGWDGTARIWDVVHGEVSSILRGHSGKVTALAFDAAGTKLLTVSDDGRARVWDAATGALATTIDGTPGEVDRRLAAALSPDGMRVAMGQPDGTIRVSNAATGHELARLAGHGARVCQLRFGPDGRRLFSASYDGTVRVWNAEHTPAAFVVSGFRGPPSLLDVAPDGDRILTADLDTTAKIWDARSGRLLGSLVGHEHAVRGGRFSTDGTRVVTIGMDNTYRVWDAGQRTTEMLVETADAAPRASHAWSGAIDARFSPDGRRLLTQSGTELQLWKVSRGPLLAVIDGDDDVYTARLSPDGRYAATGGPHGQVTIGRVDGSERVVTVPVRAGVIWQVDWSPDGRHLLVVGERGTARIYPRDGGEPLALVGHEGIVNSGSFSPDGRQVVTAGNDRTARIWDAATGQPLMTLAGNRHRVLSAAWSPDGNRVATGGWDQTVRIYNAKTGATLDHFEVASSQFLSVGFSPDGGKLVGAGHGGEVFIWDLDTHVRLLSLVGHTGPVTCATWSPDGALLATAGSDHTVRIWEPKMGRLLAIRDNPGEVFQVSWTEDSHSVLVASNDGHARLWDVHRAEGSVASLLARVAHMSQWLLVGERLAAVAR